MRTEKAKIKLFENFFSHLFEKNRSKIQVENALEIVFWGYAVPK